MVKHSQPMKTLIKFNSAGLQLFGIIIAPEVIKDKNPAVIFVHGLTGSKESSCQYADGLAELGYISFLFDMRGHGGSEGDINTALTKDFLEDCISGYDYLANRKDIDKDNISVVGSSMGGYLAAILTSKRDIKNLVLRAPADYPNYVF